MRTLGILTVVWMATTLSLGAAPWGAPQAKYSGPTDYNVFCASCHGAEGKGDGSIAKSLPKRPADLTKLTVRHNGIFPTEQVFKTVEGRSGVHNDRDMPVWADVFAKSQESLGAEAAAERIHTLVQYLETLQEKR